MGKLLDYIAAADAVGLKKEFDDISSAKVASVLELQKIEVAQNYFNRTEEVPVVATEEVK